MQPLKAHVHNGRLVLDEPTDLPEGAVVYLQPIDADDMNNDEREALHESNPQEHRADQAGQLIDTDEVLARFRARR